MFHIKQETKTQPLFTFLSHEKTGLNRARLSIVDTRTGETVAWWDEVNDDVNQVPVKKFKLDPDINSGRCIPQVRVPLLGIKPDPDPALSFIPSQVNDYIETEGLLGIKPAPDQEEMKVSLLQQASSYIPSHVSHQIPQPDYYPNPAQSLHDLDCHENSPYDVASVFISRLDVRTSKEELYAHFSQAGPIVRITRLKSKQSSQRFSGSAYVQYQFPGSAASALYNLNHSFIRGCKIVVKVCFVLIIEGFSRVIIITEKAQGRHQPQRVFG